jgi:D-xylose transport system permease protein
MTDNTQQGSTGPLLDRSDVRVKHADTIGGAIGAFVDKVRSGDLGLVDTSKGAAT